MWRLSAYFIPQTIKRTFIEFRIWDLQEKLYGEFNLGRYLYIITRNLGDAKIKVISSETYFRQASISKQVY
jgi:hypothetical protein